MKTEAQILSAMQNAPLGEQMRLMEELDAVRRQRTAAIAQDRETSFGDDIVASTLRPVLTHVQHTAATDWLADDFATGPAPDATPQVMAAAAQWFSALNPAVVNDGEEFAIQAHGMARRTASLVAQGARGAEKSFLDYVTFLRRQAASGLDQIQQTVDPNNGPKTTPLPEETFDTFNEAVDPMNVGVDEEQSSFNAPLMQQIVNGGDQGNGGQMSGGGRPSQHDTGDEAISPYSTGLDNPQIKGGSLAISHVGTLDDFVAGRMGDLQVEATGYGNIQEGDTVIHPQYGRGEVFDKVGDGMVTVDYGPNHPDGQTDHHVRDLKQGRASDDDFGKRFHFRPASTHQGGNAQYHQAGSRHPFAPDASGREVTAATGDEFGLHLGSCPNSGTPMPERFVPAEDETYAPGEQLRRVCQHCGQGHRPLPDGAGGWVHGQHNMSHFSLGSRREAASGLPMIQETVDANNQPHPEQAWPGEVAFPLVEPWTSTGPAQQGPTTGEMAYPKAPASTMSSEGRRVVADQFGASDAPGARIGNEPVANSDSTAPQVPNGSYSKGAADGRADRAAGERPSFADKGNTDPYVRGYVDSYSGTTDVTNPDVPPSLSAPGGANQNDAGAMMQAASGLVSVASRQVQASEDYGKGFKWAQRFTAGTKLVSLGSVEFESGLYDGLRSAGIEKQTAFVQASYAKAEKYPVLAARLETHKAHTARLQKAAKTAAASTDMHCDNDERHVFSSEHHTPGEYCPTCQKEYGEQSEAAIRYDDDAPRNMHRPDWAKPNPSKRSSKTAATSTDLDTMSPTSSPSPTGDTPINGPGTTPPLDGGMDPAAPGGPAPYNGTEPFGASVVPGAQQKPVDRSMGAPAPAKSLNVQPAPTDMNPTMAAFRRRVQANLLAATNS